MTATSSQMPPLATPRSHAMIDGRRAESTRRRQRVNTALRRAVTDGTEIGVSAIARAAGVDRSFLYRHRDLLEKIHAAETELPAGQTTGPAVTRASLQADLLAAHGRAARLQARIQQLETRLSEALGADTWLQAGLGAPTDTDALRQQIIQLEQQTADLRLQLDERDQDIAAARATNRDLMTQLNSRTRRR